MCSVFTALFTKHIQFLGDFVIILFVVSSRFLGCSTDAAIPGTECAFSSCHIYELRIILPQEFSSIHLIVKRNCLLTGAYS